MFDTMPEIRAMCNFLVMFAKQSLQCDMAACLNEACYLLNCNF